MLEKIGKYLQGKKSYITAALIGIAGALQHLGINIPEIVWPILSAFGLGAVRSAINKMKK